MKKKLAQQVDELVSFRSTTEPPPQPLSSTYIIALQQQQERLAAEMQAENSRRAGYLYQMYQSMQNTQPVSGYVRPKCKLPECNNPKVSSQVSYCSEHQRNLESWKR